MHLLSEPRVVALLIAQEMAVSRDQLVEVEVAPRRIDRAVESKLLVRHVTGVYTVAGSPDTWKQRLWIARRSLGTWSAVAHEAAAAIDGFTSYPEGPVTMLVPHGSHRPKIPGATVRQTRDPWLVSVRVVDNLLVTTPPRTICDLAAIASPARLAVVLDDAVAAKKVTYEQVRDELHAIMRPGKRGLPKLALLLDERGPGHVPPQSELERSFLGLFDRFGGPRPKLAWPYPGREQLNGCADAGYDDALLGLETDGRRWHQRVADIKRDRERDANAARHGIQILRLLHEHVVGAPRETWELIMETREERLRQLGRGRAGGSVGAGEPLQQGLE